MSKLALLLVLVILLPAYVLAADIGYIVKNPAYPETAIINALNEMKLSMNLSYQLIDDSEIPYIDFSDFGMILLGDESIRNVPVNTYKSLIVNPSYYIGWSNRVGSVSSSGLLAAYNLPHMITEGLPTTVKVYTKSNQQMYYLSGKKYSVKAVTVKAESTADKGYFVIATKQEPRRVFFGITKTDAWTEESKQLFKNSIIWVLIGEDADNDGYHYDEDCNDSNAEVWQLLSGYADNDNDSYGAGSLLDVCSGNELLEGYSEIDGDCDDGDDSINPNATEIPYDSIDQDCNGEDLVDVDEDNIDYPYDCNDSNAKVWQNLPGYVDNDEDGYGAGSLLDVCSGNELLEGYSIVDRDCNDNDTSINPGSEDVYKNCKNDAPVIESIGKITVQETNIVKINVSASDPENDTLTYEIDDARFIQDPEQNNIFIWQTDYEDYGNYFFTITVSDGSLESQIEVEVKVTSLNQAPICDEIPVLEWQEDTEAELNLSIYCYDPDGEAIRFYFNETSEDKNITLESLDSETGIAEFSVEENWNGEDWIIFKVSDGKDYTLTNKIILRVLPVNDTPVFTGKIENITWNEDSNLINYINLNNYFSDVDNDSLSYDVGGDYFVDINIENGLVSFYPQKDWYGEENVVFSATDGVETTYSNAVVLTVLDMNEPPEFKEMECETEILEDSEENCLLNVTDFENDSISFNVENENKLNCKIEGDKIIYQGFKDYNGNASCLIRARDKDGYADYTLNVVITPINDAPVITSYSPKDNPKLMENTNQLFSVIAEDVDGDVLDINWFLDLMKVGSGRSYLFNKEKGDYEVKVEVSDDIENVTKTWAVFVGDISDFTCQEVGGDICSEKELCRAENLLGVKDTTNCCSIPCSPSFSKTERCKNLSGSVEVEIEKPDEDEEFMAGDIIDVKVDVSNREENDHKFKVNAYLYDLTKDRKVEDDDDSVRIDKEDTETVKFEFKVEEDIDEDKNYAIFVSAIDQDGEFCNEDYVEINIEREEEVVIKEFNMPEIVKCENSFDIEAKVKNMGRDDEENVYVVIENQELGIHEKSEEFKLEEYEEDDEAVKYFTIKNPQNISGSHIIKASVFFNGESNSQEKEIVFEECKKIEVTKEEIGKIFLEGKTEGKEVKEQNNKKLIILLLISMFFVLIAITFLFYLIFKARKSI